jgi:hypothetical protein
MASTQFNLPFTLCLSADFFLPPSSILITLTRTKFSKHDAQKSIQSINMPFSRPNFHLANARVCAYPIAMGRLTFFFSSLLFGASASQKATNSRDKTEKTLG